MTAHIIAYDRSRLEKETRPSGNSRTNAAQALDDATIAEFSLITIAQMTRDELVQVIRASRLPLLTAACDEHLEFHDRATLERLVCLARRCCRNRTTVSQSLQTFVPGGE